MARISRDPDDTPIAQKILAAAIRQFGKAGIELFMLQFQPFEAEMRRFAAEIMPHVRDL